MITNHPSTTGARCRLRICLCANWPLLGCERTPPNLSGSQCSWTRGGYWAKALQLGARARSGRGPQKRFCGGCGVLRAQGVSGDESLRERPLALCAPIAICGKFQARACHTQARAWNSPLLLTPPSALEGRYENEPGSRREGQAFNVPVYAAKRA